MTVGHKSISSGVKHLDRILDGLHIGDNVVWYDDAGSLAHLFCLNFMQRSQAEQKPLIYVSFDRSPKNLLEKLGLLAEHPLLTILDCFTYGKGSGSDVFLRFYQEHASRWENRIRCVEDPRNVHGVMDAFYGIHDTLSGDVRFVFESLTGMQELWGGEDHIVNFYSHSCPRLYELQTIAYWIIEKRAHSVKLRAKINQIAQVAIDLSVRRGKTALTVLKAEHRDPDALNKPFAYWSRGTAITFEAENRASNQIELGMRLKALRTRQGLSQTELAKLVGVTPSTISQVESNQIYPSLPALFKMAEVMSVRLGAFFQDDGGALRPPVFHAADAVDVRFPEFPKGSIAGKRLAPVDVDTEAEPYLIEIPPGKRLTSHFFIHKGPEIGFVLSGEVTFHLNRSTHTAVKGDVISLVSDTPAQWKNTGKEPVRMLWLKIR